MQYNIELTLVGRDVEGNEIYVDQTDGTVYRLDGYGVLDLAEDIDIFYL